MLKKNVLSLESVSSYINYCALILFDLAGFNELFECGNSYSTCSLCKYSLGLSK